MCTPTAYIAMSVANVLQARGQEQAQVAIAKQEAEEKREQIKDQRLQVAIEAAQNANLRKEEMFTRLAANRALLSPAGVGEGQSFNALLASNRKVFKQDLRAITLEALQKGSELSYAEADVARELLATKTLARGQTQTAMISAAGTSLKALEGTKWGANFAKKYTLFGGPSRTAQASKAGAIFGGVKGK